MTRPARIDLHELDTWNAANAAARAEYRAKPAAGNYSGLRKPCLTCQRPTYSKVGLCNNCKKSEGDS